MTGKCRLACADRTTCSEDRFGRRARRRLRFSALVVGLARSAIWYRCGAGDRDRYGPFRLRREAGQLRCGFWSHDPEMTSWAVEVVRVAVLGWVGLQTGRERSGTTDCCWVTVARVGGACKGSVLREGRGQGRIRCWEIERFTPPAVGGDCGWGRWAAAVPSVLEMDRDHRVSQGSSCRHAVRFVWVVCAS